jgi:hypothetical protein
MTAFYVFRTIRNIFLVVILLALLFVVINNAGPAIAHVGNWIGNLRMSYPAQPTPTVVVLTSTPAPAGPPATNPVPGNPAPQPTSPAQGTPSSGIVNPDPGFRKPYSAGQVQPDPIQGGRAPICRNTFGNDQCNLAALSDLASDEWYVAHGDVNENSKCGVKYWTTGKPQKGELSNATWVLNKVRGPSEQARFDNVAVEQDIASRGADCPVVKVR